MKISFTLGAGQDLRINQVASRVLTENLLREERFDTNFLYFPLIASYNTFKDMVPYGAQIKKMNRNLGLCPTTWSNMLKVSLGHYRYSGLIFEELKTDYLFYSCSLTLLEFRTIADILNRGVKLIIGGPLLDGFTFNEIRCMLSEMVPPKYMENLIIIKGYVDLTTDLYSIVKNGRDHQITENDFSTFWECNHDYTTDKIEMLRKFSGHLDLSFLDNHYPFKYSVFILDNYCWWGKCKFCLYPFFDNIDFTAQVPVDKMVENIASTMTNCKSDGIFFANDYFTFNSKYEELMQKLVDKGMKICIFTGIKALQNREYIDKINKYVSAVKVGLESFNDWSLAHSNKGYTYQDIEDTKGMILKYMNKDIKFLVNMITDLPARSRAEIQDNYERARSFKRDMVSAGFDFKYSFKLLVVNNQTKHSFIDNKHVSINKTGRNVSGRWLLFQYFRDLGILTDDIYKRMTIPLTRITSDGEELETDYNIVSNSIAEEIFGW